MNAAFEYWESKVASNPEPLFVEAGFLRSYISFEEFIRERFVEFCLGKSLNSYTPKRSLEFKTEEQLLEILRGEGQFVDYFKAIDRCGNHIFLKNPFSVVFLDANFAPHLLQMKFIRNFLAHRSSESRDRYVNKVLMPLTQRDDLEVGDFLLMPIKGKKLTYYSHYIQILRDAHAVLNNESILNGL